MRTATTAATVRRALSASYAVGAVGGLLLAAGCGAGGPAAGPTPPRTPAAPVTAPPADRGPACEGDAAAKGLHLLSHAATALPGGALVTYDGGQADGTHRTADLAVTGGARQPVRVAQRVTLAGRPYTVAQICAYRVVLTGAGLHAPAKQGESMTDWPTTYDGVLPMRWHVPLNDFHGNRVVVTDVQSDPARCTISVVAAGASGPWYRDVRQGDTVEFAGRRWQITRIDPGHMTVPESAKDFSPATVTLTSLGPA